MNTFVLSYILCILVAILMPLLVLVFEKYGIIPRIKIVFKDSWFIIKYSCLSLYYYNAYERRTGDYKVDKFDIKD